MGITAETLKDSFLDDILPILETRKIQLSHVRTTQFLNWITGGKVKAIEDEGRGIFDEFFRPKNQREQDALSQHLRVDTYRHPGRIVKRVVANRWRNTIAIVPELRRPLLATFHQLREMEPAVKAEILVAVKNLVSSPIVSARGGLYRVGPQEASEIDKLSKYATIADALNDVFENSVPSDLWTSKIVEFLEQQHVIPVPQHLNYEEYKRLRDEKFWNVFSHKTKQVLNLLGSKTTGSGIEVATQASELWKETLEEYRSVVRSYRRFDNMWSPILSLLIDIIANIPGTSEAVNKLFIKIEEAFGSRFGLGSPGRLLAQVVRQGQSSMWLIRE